MSIPEELDLKRILGLTDATFAVAMTLLILDIRTPLGLSVPAFRNYFFHHLSLDIFIYIIGFITLGIFWIGSHYHHNVIFRTNQFSSWLNIVFLMTICLIPFCISQIRAYKEEKLSLIFYCLVLITASSINLYMISHAWKNKHTKANYTSSHYRNARMRIVIPIFIYLLNILICYYSTTIAFCVFLVPILLHIFPEKYGDSIK